MVTLQPGITNLPSVCSNLNHSDLNDTEGLVLAALKD